MANNLLRIGIVILVAIVIFQVVRSSNMFTSTVSNFAAPDSNSSMMQPDNLPEMVQKKENLSSMGPSYDLTPVVRPHDEDKSQLYDYNHQVLPYPQIATSDSDSQFMSGGVCNPGDAGCYSGSTLQAPDLLPKDLGDNAWNETSPQAQGNITDQNFLESGHHYGINTVGQSLKNANLQLRSDPPIPKVNVGPWLNSTITPSANRKGFEIEA
jgi:hypothetical protein